jgi:hypothetical protein
MKFQADFNHMINSYNQTVAEKEKFLVSINCKSGKNRTGILQTIFSFRGLKSNLKDEHQVNLSENDIKESFKNSEHISYLNGSLYSGNSASAHGVLKHISKTVDPEFKDLFSGTRFFNELASNGKIQKDKILDKIKKVFKLGDFSEVSTERRK